MTPLRIAIVVHGRFHMFDLARELIRLGQHVTLFTNYPKRVCERFGIPRRNVVNNVPHGIMSRGLMKMLPGGLGGHVERWVNTAFGLWAARAVTDRGPFDVAASMSGVAEDLFIELKGTPTLRVLHRGSAHIREQKRILAEDERAGGGLVEQPSEWIIAREEREYEIADLIQALSPFAMESFLDAGVSSRKLNLLQLGVNVSQFKAAPEVIEERCRRIMAGEPLRVICVGNFSRQKGARCWLESLAELAPQMHFRFVGSIVGDARRIARALSARAEFHKKVPQKMLPAKYAWADLFALPSIQDGFAVVVPQALASGLPVITTTSCGASALVENGLTGWVIPPARPDALVERLDWANAHRADLTAAVRRLTDCDFSRDWKAVAESFLESVECRLPVRTSSGALREG